VNPTISAVDLRSVLMQNATASRLQVASGYVDALRSVLAASHASGYADTQPPRLQVLSATRKASRTKVQAAVLGTTAAIRSYQLRLDNRPVARIAAGQPIFTFSVRRSGRRATVSALDANSKPVTTAQQKIKGLRKGKGGVGTGGRVGS
jgi:hypothetical protein